MTLRRNATHTPALQVTDEERDLSSHAARFVAGAGAEGLRAKRYVASAIVGAVGLQWYGLDRLTARVDLLASRRVVLPAAMGDSVVCHGPPEEKDSRRLARDAIRAADSLRWRGGTVRVAKLGHLVTFRMVFATSRRRALAAEDIKTIVWGHKSPPRRPREVSAIRAVVKEYLGEFGASRFDDLSSRASSSSCAAVAGDDLRAALLALFQGARACRGGRFSVVRGSSFRSI
jgi:hypothetical protein